MGAHRWRWLDWLRRPSARLAAGVLLSIGFVAAIVATTGFTSFVASTNTMSFCTSCHEMQAFVFEEYKDSPHYRNASGVRATCSDCHVPRAFAPKMARKIRATFVEVPNHLRGTIATREKFEAHRQRMAESVWAGMKASDSRECRACHDLQTMTLDDQKPRARAQHQDALTSGETCIDCHKGVAHKLPAIAAQPEQTDAEEDFTL
jgi:nitrate/TMAO reductase-like tetraheme cytochrome c subunit